MFEELEHIKTYCLMTPANPVDSHLPDVSNEELCSRLEDILNNSFADYMRIQSYWYVIANMRILKMKSYASAFAQQKFIFGRHYREKMKMSEYFISKSYVPKRSKWQNWRYFDHNGIQHDFMRVEPDAYKMCEIDAYEENGKAAYVLNSLKYEFQYDEVKNALQSINSRYDMLIKANEQLVNKVFSDCIYGEDLYGKYEYYNRMMLKKFENDNFKKE